MQRRTFLALAALAAARSAATRGMQLHLSCGALGIQGESAAGCGPRRQTRIRRGGCRRQVPAGVSRTASCRICSATCGRRKSAGRSAGLPVDFRGEDAAFRDGMSQVSGLRRRSATRRGPAGDDVGDADAARRCTYRANFKQHATRLRRNRARFERRRPAVRPGIHRPEDALGGAALSVLPYDGGDPGADRGDGAAQRRDGAG